MKIVTKKQMKLDELIKYGIDEDWHGFELTSDDGVDVYFTSDRRFLICDEKHISLDETFTVEVAEELTEEAYLQDVELIGLIMKDEKEMRYIMSEWRCPPDAYTSISGIKRIYNLGSLHKVNGDGTLTLLYTAEHGIPTEGTLEL